MTCIWTVEDSTPAEGSELDHVLPSVAARQKQHREGQGSGLSRRSSTGRATSSAMVQQGLGGRYARAATRRGGAVSRDGEDASYPAARATVQAGLRSYALTKAEQLRFQA